MLKGYTGKKTAGVTARLTRAKSRSAASASAPIELGEMGSEMTYRRHESDGIDVRYGATSEVGHKGLLQGFVAAWHRGCVTIGAITQILGVFCAISRSFEKSEDDRWR